MSELRRYNNDTVDGSCYHIKQGTPSIWLRFDCCDQKSVNKDEARQWRKEFYSRELAGEPDLYVYSSQYFLDIKRLDYTMIFIFYFSLDAHGNAKALIRILGSQSRVERDSVCERKKKIK